MCFSARIYWFWYIQSLLSSSLSPIFSFNYIELCTCIDRHTAYTKRRRHTENDNNDLRERERENAEWGKSEERFCRQ